jgi:hypothetical protein
MSLTRSLTSTLLQAGALYGLGRLTSDVTAEDVARVTGISRDDLRHFAMGRADTLLGAMGLRRQSTIPSASLIGLAGVAGGAALGAGVVFLLFSEPGKDVRRKIVDYFIASVEEEQQGTQGAQEQGTQEQEAEEEEHEGVEASSVEA